MPTTRMPMHSLPDAPPKYSMMMSVTATTVTVPLSGCTTMSPRGSRTPKMSISCNSRELRVVPP